MGSPLRTGYDGSVFCGSALLGKSVTRILVDQSGWVPKGSLPATPGNGSTAEWGTSLGLACDFTPAAQYEDFGHGLDTMVYKVAGKWEVTDHFSLRGAYGTYYQAPGIRIVPGEFVSGTASYTVAGGDWRGCQNYTRNHLKPETATIWSVGVIWQSEGFTDGSQVRFITDYFDIETEDEIAALATANEIADAVFDIPAGGVNSKNDGTNLADRSHPLVGRVTFNNGACVQGVTTAGDARAFAGVTATARASTRRATTSRPTTASRHSAVNSSSA